MPSQAQSAVHMGRKVLMEEGRGLQLLEAEHHPSAIAGRQDRHRVPWRPLDDLGHGIDPVTPQICIEIVGEVGLGRALGLGHGEFHAIRPRLRWLAIQPVQLHRDRMRKGEQHAARLALVDEPERDNGRDDDHSNHRGDEDQGQLELRAVHQPAPRSTRTASW